MVNGGRYVCCSFLMLFVVFLGELCILTISEIAQISLISEMIHIRVCRNFPCWMQQ